MPGRLNPPGGPVLGGRAGIHIAGPCAKGALARKIADGRNVPHQNDMHPLRCPNCREGALTWNADAVRCAACGATFPAADGVPVLVRDPQAHDADLARARAVNPLWYESEQPAEAASPWRHHIRKRRLYLEQVLPREFARRSWARAPTALDLGCGDGNHLPWLSGYAERLYGSDYNIVRLARARVRAPGATLFLADILDYPTEDAAFDLVFFHHVIEHIPDDRAALATVRRILKPGGLLVLGTPNEGCWWWQLAYRRAPEVRASTDHVHFYTAETLTAKMRDAGIVVTEVHHMGWGPPDFALDGRWRQHKWVDDLFERVGRVALPRQASSLYVLATA
jgi:SAM-dependent methyltransferase